MKNKALQFLVLKINSQLNIKIKRFDLRWMNLGWSHIARREKKRTCRVCVCVCQGISNRQCKFTGSWFCAPNKTNDHPIYLDEMPFTLDVWQVENALRVCANVFCHKIRSNFHFAIQLDFAVMSPKLMSNNNNNNNNNQQLL